MHSENGAEQNSFAPFHQMDIFKNTESAKNFVITYTSSPSDINRTQLQAAKKEGSVLICRWRDGVSIPTCRDSDRVATDSKNRVCQDVTRSHPPPHAGCPRGDPGPLPVLTSSSN